MTNRSKKSCIFLKLHIFKPIQFHVAILPNFFAKRASFLKPIKTVSAVMVWRQIRLANVRFFMVNGAYFDYLSVHVHHVTVACNNTTNNPTHQQCYKKGYVMLTAHNLTHRYETLIILKAR